MLHAQANLQFTISQNLSYTMYTNM